MLARRAVAGRGQRVASWLTVGVGSGATAATNSATQGSPSQRAPCIARRSALTCIECSLPAPHMMSTRLPSAGPDAAQLPCPRSRLGAWNVPFANSVTCAQRFQYHTDPRSHAAPLSPAALASAASNSGHNQRRIRVVREYCGAAC
jgi:hypothetical protein